MSDYTEAAERFARETAEHEMTILHDDGLYRHVRFRNPKAGFYWFDLITVPGSLIFRGDGNSYVFAREEDMFGFFRSQRGYAGAINPWYWSEKLTNPGHRDSAVTYDHEVFERVVKKHVADDLRARSAPRGISRAIKAFLADADSTHEGGAHEALRDFEFYVNEDDRFDPDVQPDYQFYDTWEWNLRDYDWWFLWACHGIAWGIAKYDEAKKAKAA